MALLQRYQELCLTFNVRPHPEIEDSLALNNRSNVICLSAISTERPLTDDDVKPVAFLVKEVRDKIFRLRFENQKISDKGASIIASVFQVVGNLVSVLLPFNEIRDEGAGAFGASFATSHAIPTVLDLTGNPISDEGLTLLFRGFCLRTSPARSHSLHLRVAQTKATEASEGAVIDGLLTGVFASLILTPVTEAMRRASFDVGTNFVECNVTDLNAKVLELEQASAFPATHDAKMKRMSARISELEKKLVDADEREKHLVKRVTFLEESVAREQEQCVKLLRQCSKLVNNTNFH